MNFAPVADIWSNPSNTVIGDRAYGSEPELTGKMTAAAVRGLRAAGVLAVIKHFPGHGDTREDSHEEKAVYPHNMERFNTFEAIPFRRGIEAGADGVMTGHIASPQIHPDTPALPAVFSPYLMRQVLRNEWRYDGLIITDALDMRGLTQYYSDEEIAINSFLAGADILLMPADTQKAVFAVREAYNDGRITVERLDASVRRILRAKLKFAE
jgi:beta-N-acetylhexosaminidase